MKKDSNEICFAHGERDHFFDSPSYIDVEEYDENGCVTHSLRKKTLEERKRGVSVNKYTDSLNQNKVAPVDYNNKFKKIDTLRSNIDNLNNSDL